MTEVSFLGWDGPFLARAAAWLVERFGSDMHGVVVAVPGRRAARRLEELLVERLVPGATPFVPPEFTTAGRLTDRLLALESTPASGLVRTLCWTQVLREHPREGLAPLLASPPADDAFDGWRALAEELRSLHGTLGGEGLGFDDVRAELDRSGPASERDRWKLLAELSRAYRRKLAALDLGDPHDSRRTAVEEARVDREVTAVLVGVTDVSGLLRATLRLVSNSVTALVCAPPELADHFDGLGCVVRERWPAVHIPLERAAWRVAQGPAGQAEAVAEALAALGEERAAEHITLGIPDADVVPFLERRLASLGVRTRRAAGESLSTSSVVGLLRAVALELRQGSFANSAALLRHPDVERHLMREHVAEESEGGPASPAAVCDEFAPEHVPRSRRLSVELRGADQPGDVRRMAAVHRALDRLLGELGKSSARRRALAEWAPVLAAFLARIYDGCSWDSAGLDDGPPEARMTVAALSAAGEALRELKAVPQALGGALPVTAGEALDLVVRHVQSVAVPDPVIGEAVEMIGWLDLPHDDAPVALLTGFNEGILPAGVRGHAFLPDGLRKRVGLPDDALRLARDLHALASILHSGREVTLISGRRDARSDPLQPSRLAFHAPDEVVLERVKAWLPAHEGESDDGPRTANAPAVRALPMGAPMDPPDSLAVTAFRDYLVSPYLFYLRRLLKLESVAGEERELNPMVFGNLVHAVLERFGTSELRHSEDPERITETLQALLGQEVLHRFGAQPLPAVTIQVRRLELRLRAFAEWQASWRAAGWRIHRVEWPPKDADLAARAATDVSLIVDDTPLRLRGRIDRVDRNDLSGEWAVIDYKTSEAGEAPRKTHGPDDEGVWKDLQMPLYRLLVQPLMDEAAAAAGKQGEPDPVVRLGYVPIARRTSATRFVEGGWTDEELAAGVECAREIVRDMREGRFSELGDFPERDPVLAAIAGRGLLSELAAEEWEPDA